MVRFLPPQADLDHLKNEAKALHKAHRRGDPEVCGILRHVHRFKDASSAQILAAELPLTEAQFALAMEYGFSGWKELRDAVLSLNPAADYVRDTKGDAMILPDPPAGIDGVNRFAAAFSLALSYLGAPADPTTVAGDSGLAFILQADSVHRPYDTNIQQLDIGWWPLDQWGAMLRVDFLGRAAGIELRVLPVSEDEYRADPALHYRKHYEPEVIASLRAGRPTIAVEEGVYVVLGWDGGNPPLLGQVSCEAEANVRRLEHFPWAVVVLGESGEPVDRRRADAEAVDFAVLLGRDEVDLSHLPGKSGGQRSWELWLDQLQDAELCGPNFYHANVVGHLRQNRTAAIAYLRAMGERHAKPVASHLLKAAGIYEDVLSELAKANTRKAVMASAAGRETLAELVERMAAMEAKAVDEIEKALANME